MTQFNQLARHFGVTVGACELADRVAFPVQTQPFEAIDQGNHSRISRAFAVRIFDTQQHLAALVFGECPAEQRRAGAANVQITSGRRGETGDDLGHETGVLGEIESRV